MVRRLKIAEVRPGRNGQLVCSICGKASYPTKAKAKEASRRAREPLYPYLNPKCRWWHLTRQPQGTDRL